MRRAKSIGQFKRVRTKSKYKSLDGYLDSIYKQNKELIDRKILTEEGLNLATNRAKLLKQSKKKMFKEFVKDYMDEGKTVDEALKKLSNSRQFMDYEDLARENMRDSLKRDKEAYKSFREATKEKGRYTKIDISKFTYIGNDEYAYGNVVVSFKHSPERIEIIKL